MTKQKPASFSPNWNLDTLFPGGSTSPALQSALHHLKHQIQQFKQKFEHISDLKTGILHFQELEGHCHDLQELITCLMAQNVEDQEALKLNSQIMTLRAYCDSLSEELNALLSGLDKDAFALLLSDPDLQSIAFTLQERRQNTNEKLPIEQECLVHQLAVDGYQGWNEIYHTFIGHKKGSTPLNSKIKKNGKVMANTSTQHK